MIIWHRGQVGQTAGSWAPPQAHGGGIFEDGANEPALSMLPEGKSYSLILTWKGPWTRAGVTDTVGSMFKKCFVDGGLFREFPEFALTCLPCTTLHPGYTCLINTNLLITLLCCVRLHLRRM